METEIIEIILLTKLSKKALWESYHGNERLVHWKL